MFWIRKGEDCERASTKTCAVCNGWFRKFDVIVGMGQGGALATAFAHKHCLVEELINGPLDGVESKFDEIVEAENQGTGLLARFERDKDGAER